MQLHGRLILLKCLLLRLLPPRVPSSPHQLTSRVGGTQTLGEMWKRGGCKFVLSFHEPGLWSIYIRSSCFLLRTILWRVLSVIMGLCASEVGNLPSKEAQQSMWKKIHQFETCLHYYCFLLHQVNITLVQVSEHTVIPRGVWLKRLHRWRCEMTPRPSS